MIENHRHPVLREDTACLTGNLAIVRGALEAGVQFVSGYPGTPASEVGDTFAAIADTAGIHFEYSINEKISVETAFAASLTGARSLCSMKHLGLNFAGDPAATIPYVGVKGGMVIVSAGDPSMITSPNEQDQRHFNGFLHYPVFDPATPSDALEMTRFAFPFSEETRLPVLLRPTTRICHSGGMVQPRPLPKTRNNIRFEKDPPRYVPTPPNARRMRKELTGRISLAEDLLLGSDFFPRTGTGKTGIVAGGVAHAYASRVIEELGVQERISLLKIGAYPIPEMILADFLGSVESALVVEELTPIIEEKLIISAFRNGRMIPILGKKSGHFPLEFEYSPDLVESVLRKALDLGESPGKSISIPELPPRPPVLCPGCPHRTSFYHVRRVFGQKTVYVNDIGCYTLGYGPPLDCCDVLLCMGSSISKASAISRTTGERVVAFIGDSTFFHSGLPALTNALQYDDNITLCILDNHVTAMTGFQPSAVSDRGPEAPSIEKAVRGLGAKNVVSVDPFDSEASVEALKKARAGTGVNVIIFNSPCVIYEEKLRPRKGRGSYDIDQELCDGCTLCVRVLGCPAITIEEDKYLIDPDLCDGCDLCAQVCNRNAIHRKAKA